RLNLDSLKGKIESGRVSEVILALGNDMEGEATCHYLKEVVIGDHPIKVSRIGFGLPSGGNVTFADEVTLRSALEGRTDLDTG
ncbi:MAG TPA: recombination protein RecR, partial [Opitutae bacterium]|nr:recombination protein RecR [Opitutae bacterium]